MVNGRPCSCVAEAARTLRREEINAASPLALCSFDTFELDRYPAEPEPELGGTRGTTMGKVLAYCQRYANSFTPESRGLMFIGSAGLGKTHMALAIADTVLNRGFDVLYTSSAALAAQLGREHFDRAAEDPWLDACKEADLLILDDLGTEYISQLTISVLYELINTRMLCHRPTIYTSNIVDSSIFEARYTEKVASRILGSCQIFKFFGTDQRLKRGRQALTPIQKGGRHCFHEKARRVGNAGCGCSDWGLYGFGETGKNFGSIIFLTVPSSQLLPG